MKSFCSHQLYSLSTGYTKKYEQPYRNIYKYDKSNAIYMYKTYWCTNFYGLLKYVQLAAGKKSQNLQPFLNFSINNINISTYLGWLCRPLTGLIV